MSPVGERILYKGDVVVPTVIDFKNILSNKEKHPWLKDFQ
jgi:hypothetical protein